MGCCSSALHRCCCGSVMCSSEARLDGKTVVVTGSNTGIGKETAVDLAKRGARVIMACRNEDRALPAVEDVKKRSGSDAVKFMRLDLASLASVREFVAQYEEEEARLDILVNNAGVLMWSPMKSEDGFELQMAVNHLGHFLLTNLLLPKLRASGPGSRVITITSSAHKKGGGINLKDLMMENNYNGVRQYQRTKMANVLFTKELAKRLKGKGVNAYAVHTGVSFTELGRHAPAWLSTSIKCPCISAWLKTWEEGAQTTIHCAVSDEAKEESGLYYADCRVKEPSDRAKDRKLAKELWAASAKLVRL